MKRQDRTFRRRWLSIAVIFAGTMLPAFSGWTTSLATGRQRATIWTTIASTRPGLGCSVPVNVELRADGGAISGMAVEIVLSNGDGDIISLDETTTDGDGIASLAFETSNAIDGMNGWLDINVNGAYVTGTSILPRSDGSCDGESTMVTTEVDVATGGSGVSAGSSNSVTIAGIPAYQQSRSLSCEYASIYIATSAFGNPIYEESYLSSTPQADNPHFGFRGNIDGPWGITDDYGIYAEALVPTLNDFGYVGEVAYQPNADYLRSHIDANHPMLVWIATRGDTGFYEQDADGNSFKLVPNEHVVVVYGYDDGGIYVSDPGKAIFTYYSWSWFLDAWSVMDGMSLAVYPAS